MIESGLVSVSFRNLPASRIIALAADAGLASIEWGGDIHVPSGDLATATEVARQTADAGLRISAYGSYYRAAAPEGPSFEAVLDSASALGTKMIRIWAGTTGSAEAGPAHRAAVAADLSRCCDLAAFRGITLAMEFHGGTLTDTVDSTLALVAAVGRPNFGTFWQPPVAMPFGPAVAGLTRLLPYIFNAHVFHWWPDASQRRPLVEGIDRWQSYLRALSTGVNVRYASLEFVTGDDVEQFRRDAAVLNAWLVATPCPACDDLG